MVVLGWFAVNSKLSNLNTVTTKNNGNGSQKEGNSFENIFYADGTDTLVYNGGARFFTNTLPFKISIPKGWKYLVAGRMLTLEKGTSKILLSIAQEGNECLLKTQQQETADMGEIYDTIKKVRSDANFTWYIASDESGKTLCEKKATHANTVYGYNLTSIGRVTFNNPTKSEEFERDFENFITDFRVLY